ncbi:MAG: hypothetical protein WAO00_10520, partial [Chthoniobacterales bacterium]
MRLSLERLLACVVLTAVFALTADSAQSAVLTVTNTQDSGAGSLRDTISAASAGDTIQFDAALNGQTITLTTGELRIVDKDVTINGPGADKLTVQRATAEGIPAFRIFNIAISSSHAPTVGLSGLTLANGRAPADGVAPQAGGAIYFDGLELTIDNCVISGNSAGSGGAVYVSYHGGFSPTLVLTNSVISGNSAISGGGLYITFITGSISARPGRLTMTNSTVSGNVATHLGGGLYNLGGASITRSTISGNDATMDAAGGGGGIYNANGLSVSNSTISGNSASLGGGIKNVRADFFFLPGFSTITSCTISDNSATQGGGIYSFGPGIQQTRNSIIARNSSANGPDMKGDLTSQGFNLIGNN